MEHTEDSSEQPSSLGKTKTCKKSKKKTKCLKSSKQSVESRSTSKKKDHREPEATSSGSEDRRELTICEPAKEQNEVSEQPVSEEWLHRFLEQLGRTPVLWKPGMHISKCKEKSARGFAYLRLLAGLEPCSETDNKARIARARYLCKEFFNLHKQQLRQAAVDALELDLEASPDDALRRCPVWVRRAEAFLNQMPLMVAHLNARHWHKGKPAKEKRPSYLTPSFTQSSPLLGLPDAAAGARLMRRVVRGMRRAAREHGGPGAEAVRAVAARLRDGEDRILALWSGMRKLSMYKFRSSLVHGDAPTASGRLDTLDWAIVDLLLIYDAAIINESQYQNYVQLSALLATFHLVQRFQLERPGQHVAPQEWLAAADWYSRDRKQMSAVALQKRWCELKQDARRRFAAQARHGAGPAGPTAAAAAPFPLHYAIVHKYGHVLAQRNMRSWRKLVADGAAAPPTSERGPAPGEARAPRAVSGDSDSDTDTAPAEDDDDVTIVEKSLEIIDLSEDNKEDKTGEVNERPSERDETCDDDSNSSKNKESTKEQVEETTDRNTDTNVNSPSPKSDVLEALKGLDVDNVETTIVFDSDEEEVKSNVGKRSEVPDEDSVASANEVTDSNESQIRNDKTRKHRRQSNSSYSSDGNLVMDIEDDQNSDNKSSKNREENTSKQRRSSKENTRCHKEVWKDIENEMLPPPFNKLRPLSGHSQILSGAVNDEKDEKSDENVPESLTKYPILSELLLSKCIFASDQLAAIEERTKKIQENIKKRKSSNCYKKPGPSSSQRKVLVSDLIREVKHGTARSFRTEIVDDDDGPSSGSEGSEEEGEGRIDPKLLMDTVVLLERLEDILPQIKSMKPSEPPPSLTRELSRESTRSISPEILSLLVKTERNRSQTPSPQRSRSPTPESSTSRESESQINLYPTNNYDPCSLLQYFAAKRVTVPEFYLCRKNIELLKTCRPCSVVLQREDLGERGRVGSRVSKKVELPDIEEVRRNNRSMLTAQVAPLLPPRTRRLSPLTSEPSSSGSDSDWTPDADGSVRPVRSSRTDRVAGGPRRSSTAVNKIDLERLFEKEIEGECYHSDATGRVPYDLTCSRCMARMLSAPPESWHIAQLQKQMLRRAVRDARNAKYPEPAPHSVAFTTATTTSAPAVVYTSTATPAVVATEAPDYRHTATSRSTKRRPSSPVDAEAAAREWLRQKNIAAEKFGVKPRSYKKPTPAVLPATEQATLEPINTKENTSSQVVNRDSGYRVVLNNIMGGATVLPLTEENVAKHSLGHAFMPTTSSATLFNPHAVAHINRTLGALRPAVPPPPPPPHEEPDPAFRPLITNVHSLAPKRRAPSASDAPLLKAQRVTEEDYVVIPRPAGSPLETDRDLETDRTDDDSAENLPQVVRVAGNIHLPPASVGQGLHLVVSQKTSRPLPSLIKYQQNPPDTVAPNDMIQNVQRTSRSNVPYAMSTVKNSTRPPLILNSVLAGSQASNTTPSVVLNPSSTCALQSNSTRPPLILNSVLAGTQASNTTPSLVLSPSSTTPQTLLISTIPRTTMTTSSALYNPVSDYSSTAGRAAQPAQMLVRSVQSGPPGASQPAPRPAPARYTAPAQPAPSQPAPAQTGAQAEQNALDKEFTMPDALEWNEPLVLSSQWASGRDTTSLSILCTGPRGSPGWVVRSRRAGAGAAPRGYVLVSEQQPPPARAAYWATRPRVRLALPSEDDDDPPTEPPKPPECTGYLKVRAFARMSHTSGTAEAPSEKLPAPARVSVNGTVYQKLSDEPLVYAKLLVAVPDHRACRSLLARGAPLQLYCLTTGNLFPLEATPKKDSSRVTLSGDVAVSGALVSLANRLYECKGGDDPTQEDPESETAEQDRTTEPKDTADPKPAAQQDDQSTNQSTNKDKKSAAQLLYESARQSPRQPPDQSVDQSARQSVIQLAKPHDARSALLDIIASKTIQRQPSSSTTLQPAPAPRDDVIELSD